MLGHVCARLALLAPLLALGAAETEVADAGATKADVQVFGELASAVVLLSVLMIFALMTKTLGHPLYTYLSLVPLLLIQGRNESLAGLNLAWIWWASLGLAGINLCTMVISTREGVASFGFFSNLFTARSNRQQTTSDDDGSKRAGDKGG